MTEHERIVEAEQRSINNSEAIKEIKSDIKELQKKQEALYQINTNIELMAQSMAAMNVKVGEVKEEVSCIKKDVKSDISLMKERVDKIEHKPEKKIAEKYGQASDIIFKLVVTGLVGYILTQILPTIF